MPMMDHRSTPRGDATPTLPCDVARLAPDVAGVGALAMLQLGARDCGYRIQLVRASPALRDLIAFMGLDEVLPS